MNNPARMAELASRAFDRAHLELGPTQINIPRDYFYGEAECEIPQPVRIARGPGGGKGPGYGPQGKGPGYGPGPRGDCPAGQDCPGPGAGKGPGPRQ